MLQNSFPKINAVQHSVPGEHRDGTQSRPPALIRVLTQYPAECMRGITYTVRRWSLMVKMKNKIPFSVLLIILLVGCTKSSDFPSLVSPQEITPIKLPPTWTPTITNTPRSSATPIVVETFTPVPPITTIPQNTQTANPDDLWANYIAIPSPHGEWTAYFNIVEIKVVNAATGTIWTLPCDLFERCQYILPIKWSQNGEVLFFGASSYLGGVPQPITISFYSTAGKINIRTGKWERLFPDPTGYFDFSISSDDTYVAYTELAKEEQSNSLSVLLTVLNLKSHQKQRYNLGPGEGGNIVWSPYEQRFIFQIRDSSEGSSIAYCDADVDVLRFIVKNKESDFSIQSWREDNLVLIQETDWEKREPSLWHLNPFTNDFSH